MSSKCNVNFIYRSKMISAHTGICNIQFVSRPIFKEDMKTHRDRKEAKYLYRRKIEVN